MSTIDLDYKRRAVQYWKSGQRGRLSFKNVRHKFKLVTSISQLYNWENQLMGGGSARDRSKEIEKYTLKKFDIAKEEKKIVHDKNIRRWALEAKKELGDKTFKAGKTWILNFKRKNKIVSRKINKFISKKKITEKAKLEEKGENFVKTIIPLINDFGPENVYNADESGFNLEVHSGRTLTSAGVKTVEAMAQSVNSTTHSYTIMPTVTAGGQLLSPLYIVLKEPTGTFLFLSFPLSYSFYFFLNLQERLDQGSKTVYLGLRMCIFRRQNQAN